MVLVPLALLAVVVGAASIVVDRRLQKQEQLPTWGSMTEPIQETISSGIEAGTSWLQGWYDKVMNRQSAELPQQFHTWVANAPAANEDVRNWIASLSENSLQAFTDHLAIFCSDMGFELGELVEGKLNKNPQLAQDMSQVVLQYCWACQQAAVSQYDLNVYKQLLAFERNPDSRRNQAFGQALFVRLVENNLTSVTLSDYDAVPTNEKPQLILRAIDEVAEKDNEAFKRALQEVGQGPAAVSPSTAASQSES